MLPTTIILISLGDARINVGIIYSGEVEICVWV